MLSICIVTYNNENDIITCLSSLPWRTLALEVHLIDNRSNDHTIEKIDQFCHQFPDFPINIFINKINLGYSTGINQALSLCKGNYILILGPDTKILPGSLETMISFLKRNPKAGLVAPQLVDTKGKIQSSCRRFPKIRDVLFELTALPRIFPKHFSPEWKMPHFNHSYQSEVEQPEATCLMTHLKAYTMVGSMDERFPIFFNDVDWCRRFLEKDWKIYFYPNAKIQHKKGASIYPHRISMIWKSHQGFYRYFDKYYTSFLQKLFNQMVGLLLIISAYYRSILILLFNNKK
jgi:GT2 family glycosyltransferase